MPLIAPPFDQPTDLLKDMDAVVIRNIMGSDRTQQTRIGPSQMGCERCVARHFMGLERDSKTQEVDATNVPWLPYVGTAMHAQLEKAFEADNDRLLDLGLPIRWMVERRVPVGKIGDEDVDGSCDLYDMWTATVIDHKLVGKSKLDKVRRHGHPGIIYFKQANIYGRGWQLLGYPVKHVAVRFYPRNALALSQGHLWTAPYDPEAAEAAVSRAQAIATIVAQLPKEQWSDLLAKLEADPDCFSCNDYETLGPVDAPTHGMFDQPTPFSKR